MAASLQASPQQIPNVTAPAKPRLLIFIVAYHAETTIRQVLRRIPARLGDEYDVEVLIIDDGSSDQTFRESAKADAEGLPFKVTILFNPVNQGYGGNQKIGYHYAISFGFDFVALLHGDGQYAPEMLPELVRPLREGQADAVFGSRMMKAGEARRGGMPLYKYAGNVILSMLQNRILGMTLSEFHSGYRVYAVKALSVLPFERNTNDFHFDTEIIIQLNLAGKRIAEIPIPTYYGDEICRVNGLRYARDVIKASVQARLQSAQVFYDRRFDCRVDVEGERYPSKLEFDSTHSRVVGLVPAATRVLDLGSGLGVVGAALKEKGCHVVGCDMERGPFTASYDKFVTADLDQGIPAFDEHERYDYILCLDVIEHLGRPEDFLDQLRELTARTGAQVILTTANIGFAPMRLSLLLGRFEYGKRGILDLTHTRLFTFATMRRAMRSAGFELLASEGVVVPLPFIFGDNALSRALLRLNGLLVRIWPSMFGFQILLRAKARPNLETLLSQAQQAAVAKGAGDRAA
ncbi:bifunctional glycosyltransferase/class I SAM-dependent methyltransferase [Bradyrhizobium liaoningense]|uniref:bifunctional glycosyltransferase/class I SAM-dependent methyltransferase n=1 Tax=Bradyrhizobium liaoningense TaxID=43992 RepID=UPI001BA7B082|nr:bifunctional glycosyltransferase/class I SAM-dependent methyltransferase [Bradyrhizobium liaoningense]MBR0715352.1 glycosyltransferase [Bradyrhizobium liaoningense]